MGGRGGYRRAAAVGLISLLLATVVACRRGDQNSATSTGTGGAGTGGTTSTGGGGNPGSGGAEFVFASLTFAASKSSSDAIQVWVADADGGHLAETTRGGSKVYPNGANDGATLSPDGKTLIFASGRDYPVHDKEGFVESPTLRMLYILRDGGSAKRLTENDPTACAESDARFSHDGSRVVFAMSCAAEPNAKLARIFAIDVDGSHQQRLLSDDDLANASADHPVFGRDDKSIIFVSDFDQTVKQLFAIDAAGGKASQLTTDSVREAQSRPMISADGQSIFYVAGSFEEGVATQMTSVELDGTNPTVLFEVPPSNYDYDISNDGETFVFVVNVATKPRQTSFNVSTSKLDGTGVHALTQAFAEVSQPFLR
jgi:Tol biopolymer transport system component